MKNKRLLAFLAIITFAAGAYLLGWSTFFTVSEVKIEGTNLFLPQQVTVGEKLARVEPRAVAAAYKKLDFIEDAQVSRNWLSGKVTITITNRKAIAIYNNLAIDRFGKAFPNRASDPKDLPSISAPTIGQAVEAADFYQSLPTDMRTGVTIVKVRSTGAYVLEVNAGKNSIEVRWGLPVDNLLKAKVYKALLQQSENSTIKSMDLSAPHAPIVK